MQESFFNTRLLKIGNCEITISVPDKANTRIPHTPLHYHLHFELHFITAGNILFSANDQDVFVENKSTVIIPPSVVHGVKEFVEGERFYLTLLIKKTNTPDPDNTYENIFSRWHTLKDITVLKNSYEKALKKILHFVKIGDSFHNVSAKHLLALLLLDISGALPTAEPQSAHKKSEIDEQFYRAAIIESCIDAHYQDTDASIRLVADLLHLSEKQAERTVKKLTGMSFKQLLLKQRMFLAKDMILFEDKKLYHVAQSVGYNSYEVFYKAFSNYFKMSPTEFKKKMR